MKKLTQKVVGLILFIWFILGNLIQFDQLKRLMNQGVAFQVVQKHLIIYIVYSFLGTVLALYWVYYNKKISKLNWKAFLTSEIDLLDEDERGLQLDAKAKNYAMNWLFALLVLLIPFSLSFLNATMISIRLFLILIGAAFTVYELSYFLKIRTLYHDY